MFRIQASIILRLVKLIQLIEEETEPTIKNFPSQMNSLKQAFVRGLKRYRKHLPETLRKEVDKDKVDATMLGRKVVDMLTDDVISRSVKWTGGKLLHKNDSKIDVTLVNQTARVMKADFWLDESPGYSNLVTLLPGASKDVEVAVSKKKNYNVRLNTKRGELFLAENTLIAAKLAGKALPAVVRALQFSLSTAADFYELSKEYENHDANAIVVYAGEKKFEVKFAIEENDREIASSISEYYNTSQEDQADCTSKHKSNESSKEGSSSSHGDKDPK